MFPIYFKRFRKLGFHFINKEGLLFVLQSRDISSTVGGKVSIIFGE